MLARASFPCLFDRLPVRISTSDLHHRILRKKLYHIRAYDFGVQFSFNIGHDGWENRTLDKPCFALIVRSLFHFPSGYVLTEFCEQTGILVAEIETNIESPNVLLQETNPWPA